MKKIIYVLLLIFVVSCNDDSVSVANEYNGYPVFSTQEELDEFGKSNYSVINGRIIILNGINNVNSLNNIKTINGDLIINNGENLKTLKGLENLKTISGKLQISYDGRDLNFWDLRNALSSLTGLNNLNELGRLIIKDQPTMSSIDGLQNLEILEELQIINNSRLESLGPLFNIKTTSFDKIHIINNSSIINLIGLSNISQVTSINISSNSIIDFCSLRNLFKNGSYSEAIIEDNEYNPSVQDIIDGNCKILQ